MTEEHSENMPTFKSIREGKKGTTLDDLEEEGKELFAGEKMEKFNSLLAEGYAFLVMIESAPMLLGAEGDPHVEIQIAIDGYLEVKQILFEMINNARQASL